ncbi:MAG: biotin/lipoyl-containing protein [Clostridia bacterium]|nr:biotin/lipoyl-containing protein [Clostridia bacterium]
MRKFHVNVNGTPYEVEVEEIAAGAAPAAPVQAAAPAPAAAAPVAAGATSVTAPMPGNILDIKVKVGDMVEANTVVIMLEAMKMENEIFAGAAGKVTAINVTKGSTVNSGDVLVVIG